MRSPYVVGAQLIVLVNGARYAECTSFEFEHIIARAEIVGIDTNQPFEIAPKMVRFQANMGYMRRQGGGGAFGQGMAAPFSKTEQESYWSLLILNRRDQSILFRADQCMATNVRESAQARGRMTGSISFTGLAWSNEVEAAQIVLGGNGALALGGLTINPPT